MYLNLMVLSTLQEKKKKKKGATMRRENLPNVVDISDVQLLLYSSSVIQSLYTKVLQYL